MNHEWNGCMCARLMIAEREVLKLNIYRDELLREHLERDNKIQEMEVTIANQAAVINSEGISIKKRDDRIDSMQSTIDTQAHAIQELNKEITAEKRANELLHAANRSLFDKQFDAESVPSLMEKDARRKERYGKIWIDAFQMSLDYGKSLYDAHESADWILKLYREREKEGKFN